MPSDSQIVISFAYCLCSVIRVETMMIISEVLYTVVFDLSPGNNFWQTTFSLENWKAHSFHLQTSFWWWILFRVCTHFKWFTTSALSILSFISTNINLSLIPYFHCHLLSCYHKLQLLLRTKLHLPSDRHHQQIHRFKTQHDLVYNFSECFHAHTRGGRGCHLCKKIVYGNETKGKNLPET